MILSVSRRTDIPNYYAEWFLNRVKAGYLYVKNPMNDHQVSRIDITPAMVDCIVFWTKNPIGIMDYLEELYLYNYYFQFTLNGYGTDIERNIPDKKSVMIPRFQELSAKIGKEKVIWRYDPILFTEKYTAEYHLAAFGQIAESLKGYTEKCVISFVDIYRKKKSFFSVIDQVKDNDLIEFAAKLKQIADENGITIATCAEKMDLKAIGIEHNSCIDQAVIERILDCRIKVHKDKNQRADCGCVESVEVGSYNTCKNGCAYCYAAYDGDSLIKNCQKYDPLSPILCGEIRSGDKITERKIKSFKNPQMSIEDFVTTW